MIRGRDGMGRGWDVTGRRGEEKGRETHLASLQLSTRGDAPGSYSPSR